jgi:YHS domain-containing protein
MTTPRRKRKASQRAKAFRRAVVGAVIWLGAVAVAAAGGGVVVDRLTGLAIAGFDPVAYFTDRGPKPGDARFETVHQGAVWRFRNEGNRIAFREHPEVYAPQFGGYDPVEIAGKKGIPGHPRIWLVASGRLYFFVDERSRGRFDRDVLEKAIAQWPAVREQLAD